MCIICSQNNFHLVRDKLRYGITRRVLKCAGCELVFLEPGKNDLSEYYAREYRKIYSAVLGKKLESREMFEMMLPFQEARIKELVPILQNDFKVLDVGSSSGYFLYSIKKYVHECIGIEFNQDDTKFTNEILNIKTYSKPIEETDLQKNYFDLITMFQVVEHLPDPIDVITTLRAYLKPGGWICVEVPNLNDALLSIYKVGAFADFWFIEPHLFYFSPSTLKALMEKAGFTGTVKSTQEYSFLNHLHWMIAGEPQLSAEIGMSTPKLVTDLDANPEIAKTLNEWIKNIDGDYRRLMEKLGIGGKLLFIGKKI